MEQVAAAVAELAAGRRKPAPKPAGKPRKAGKR
jgi:hypothetical protein